MDHIRSLVAFTHDPKAADYIQFVAYLEIYTELRYKLEILKQYHDNSYLPNSLLATASLTLHQLIDRNSEIPYDSVEYKRNELEITRLQQSKEREIDAVTEDFNDSIEAVVGSVYIARYKYSGAYLDMLRRQLKNHCP